METRLAPGLLALVERFAFPRRSPALEARELAVFNRDVFGKMFDKFLKRAHSFSKDSDVEEIHDLRVLARRQAEYLLVLEPAAPTALLMSAQDWLARFMKALGPVRNSDVSRGIVQETLKRDLSALERDALLHLDARLLKRREKRLAAPLAFFHREDTRERLAQLAQLRRNLARASAVQREVFAGALSAHADQRRSEALAHLRHEAALSDHERLHGLRIALRRMRYTGEACRKAGNRPSRADIQRIRRFSSALGEQHDYSVLLARIDKEAAKLPKKGEQAERLRKGLERVKARYAKKRDALTRVVHRLAGLPS